MTCGVIKSGVTKNRSGERRRISEIRFSAGTFVVTLVFTFCTPVWAQQQAHDHENGDAANQPQTSDAVPAVGNSSTHDTMDHDATDHESTPATGTEPAAHDASAAAPHTQSAQMNTRDPHAYAEGEDFGPLGQPRLSDQHNFAALIVDRLEAVSGRDNSSHAYELQAWYGRTFDRLTLKAEGDVDSGRLQESETELLWSHAVAKFWDTQLGVRYDAGVEPDRRWLAAGIQGLAPYWFEVNATAYVGEHGDSALRLWGEYDLLLTQRLILRPEIEADFFWPI